MPRISPSLLRKVRACNPLLSLLLPVCRDLRSSRNELRWLKEHATRNDVQQADIKSTDLLLRRYVRRRARGEPLQYILGSEYFGDLEIQCEPGVLIPRQDTAASVVHFVHRLSGTPLYARCNGRLRVLDLCTGSGCIPLLFHHEFYSKRENAATELDITAIDISSKARSLAHKNLKTRLDEMSSNNRGIGSPMLRSLENFQIIEGDVMSNDPYMRPSQPKTVLQALQQAPQSGKKPEVDVLISNPPYISSKTYRTTTARSVRLFEPQLALVPMKREFQPSENDGDAFYPHLLALALELKALVVLFEVADMDQAQRVAALAAQQRVWETIEIWRDEPSAMAEKIVNVDGRKVTIHGTGHGRSVFASRLLLDECSERALSMPRNAPSDPLRGIL